ncbi:tRNA epoxyqueuosine(34) reductase QueG [Roseateles koreensis]|uniref:Epoxyqueuosine reductase n=1 Tax=Roseateles koreensis TaxID=2987526 RepID=A0ABT5KS72_9BURK|nr:tRNA epoxyqueuosine(34) reductase QueG [Roseateles koreensis]MDC8785285.1 tRNA epoxyqueuosine(34) reductase QueG [Roseateles koreensis]
MTQAPRTLNERDGLALLDQLRDWAHELGFSQIGVADIDLSTAEPGLLAWLQAGFHGTMHYMQAHGLKRARPAELVPGTLRVLTARMDYLPRHLDASDATPAPDGAQDVATAASTWQTVEWQRLGDPHAAQVSIYARGRDYHKVLRSRLQKLADRLAAAIGPLGYRVFTDSAPVLEVELAARSGIGWRGKHTLTLHREAGSMFFLGEIYLDLPLPLSEPVTGHCGQCQACIDVCPTRAIVAPYRVDARRCISYLTIEHEGAIPEEMRPLMGNRIYGCDDCQLVCPWNKFARRAVVDDFDARAGFQQPKLLQLWAWDEAEFLKRTEGSAIRRIGHERWRRNLAVAMGNALRWQDDAEMRATLVAALPQASPLLAEHIVWALAAGSSPYFLTGEALA